MSYRYWSGYNRIPETTELQPMEFHQVWTYLGRQHSKDKANKSRSIDRTWITSISSNKDEAFSSYRKAVNMGYEDLLTSHTKVRHIAKSISFEYVYFCFRISSISVFLLMIVCK
jgi:hypothetical protein